MSFLTKINQLIPVTAKTPKEDPNRREVTDEDPTASDVPPKDSDPDSTLSVDELADEQRKQAAAPKADPKPAEPTPQKADPQPVQHGKAPNTTPGEMARPQEPEEEDAKSAPFSSDEVEFLDEAKTPMAVLVAPIGGKQEWWKEIDDYLETVQDEAIEIYPRGGGGKFFALMGGGAEIQKIADHFTSQNGAVGADNRTVNKFLIDLTKLPEDFLSSSKTPDQVSIAELTKDTDKGLVGDDIRKALKTQWKQVQSIKGKEKKADTETGAQHDVAMLSRIFSNNPTLILVSARNKQAEWDSFLKSEKVWFENPLNVFELYPGEVKKSSQELEDFYAFIVPMAERAKFSKTSFLVDEFTMPGFDKKNPFEDMTYKNINDTNTEAIRRALTTQWQKVVNEVGGDTAELTDVSCLQMKSAIPLNYTRFLDQKLRKYELYLGGVQGAGVDDMVYVKADKKEVQNFIAFLKDFRPKTRFSFNLRGTVLEEEFTAIKPHTYLPASALVLTARGVFEPGDPKSKDRTLENGWATIPEQLLGDDEKKVWDEVQKEIKAAKDEKSREEAEQKLPKATQHDLLCRIATYVMHSPVKKPGRLINGQLVHGDLMVHYNIDMKKAIIWGPIGKKTSVDAQGLKKALSEFVKDVDTTYL